MKQSFVIAIIVVMQLLATFATQVLIIRLLGIGIETDSYIAAQTVPAIIVAILFAALKSVWLPRLTSLHEKQAEWSNTLSIALGQSVILSVSLILLLAFSAHLWVGIIFTGFSVSQKELTIYFTVILLISSVFTILSSQLTIALRTIDRFYVAELITLIGIIGSLCVIYYALPVWGITAVPVIILLRSLLIFIIQMSLVKWPSISCTAGWRNRETWLLMKPIFAGASLFKTSPIIDRYWVSQSPAGNMTIFNLAQMAMSSLVVILERSVCVPVVTTFGRYAASSDFSGLRREYLKGVFKITILVLIFICFWFAFKPVFVKLLMTILNIEADSALNLWILCLILTGYFHAAVSGTLPVAVFHALDNTATPVKIGIAGFLVSLVMKAIGFIYFSLPGLAVAISIYYIGNTLFMIYYVEKELHERISKRS